MSRIMYNCPNCAAPIGYHEICPHCGTALDWTPTVHMTLKVKRRSIRKCVAVFMEDIRDYMLDEYIDGILKEQLGQAASEIWERETERNQSERSIDGVPPHMARHTATVYFMVKEGKRDRSKNNRKVHRLPSFGH